MNRTVECFYPGQSFPSISITGTKCALDCKHCSRKYLEGMIPATTPEDLESVAEALAERGARGFLMSGGVDGNGKVDYSRFVEAIRDIKNTTDLKINAHVGLTPRDELEALVGCGVDSFSVDVYGSDSTVHDVLGIRASSKDYFDVVKNLQELGAYVAPHICVGIDNGQLKGEMKAISRLKVLNPKTLVFISLIPTKGTAFETVAAPSGRMMRDVVRQARADLPNAKLLLGCMRSKTDRSWEFDLVNDGLDGIVLPAGSTVDKLRASGYTVKKRAECCALI